jgi:hypothetical protein
MRIALGVFTLLLALRLGAQETLVAPLQLNQVAKAHHCFPVVGFVVDEKSQQAASFEVHYEPHDGATLKAFLAGWCTQDTSQPKGPYTLLIWAEREDQPLRSRPDEIRNVKRIGHPIIEAWPTIPHGPPL